MPKISDLTTSTALTADDYLVLVDAPGGTPATKKITAANAKTYLAGSGVGLTGVVDVVAEGATGDGSTDDATAIQAAIDGAPDGGQVYFPAGTYIVGTTIKLKANCRYTGSSRLRSTIKMKAAANLNAVVAAEAWAENTASNTDNPIHIEHLRVDGNKANQSSGTGHGIALNNYWSTLEHLYIHDCRGDGVLLSTARQDGTETGQAVENMLFRVDCRQCDGNGIHIYDPDPVTAQNAPDGYIIACKIETTLLNGVLNESTAGWSITDTHVYGARKSGIRFDRAYACSIVNNYIESIGTSATPGYYAAIDCQGFAASDVPSVIANNRGSQSMSGVSASSNIYGVYVYASSGATTILSVTGNTFLGSTHANTSHGLVLENQSGTSVLNVAVSGNMFTGWDTNTRPIVTGGTFNIRGDMFEGYQAAAYAASFQPNTHIGNIFGITLTGNISILNPFSGIAGEQITFILTQDGTGGRTTTFDTDFKVNWTPNTTAAKKNTISFAFNGTNWVQTATAVNL